MSSEDVIASQISDTIITLKNDFLDAFKHGAQAWIKFERSWQSFSDTLSRHITLIPQETLAMAYALAEAVEAVTSDIIEEQKITEDVEVELNAAVAHILVPGVDMLSIGSTSKTQGKFVLHPFQESPSWLPAVSSYIPSAYSWLLANLHDPFPPSAVQSAIARNSQSKSDTVNKWFLEARRKIGWNKMRKERFDNNKRDMVDAATRYFKGLPPKLASEGDYQYQHTQDLIHTDFVELEEKAKGLYPSLSQQTDLAFTLDIPAEDSTVPGGSQHRKRRKQAPPKGRLGPGPSRPPYPSPEPSPEPYLESSPEPQLTSRELSVVPISSARKRGSSIFDDEDQDRSHKRTRYIPQVRRVTNPAASLPSPAPSLSDLSQEPVTSPVSSPGSRSNSISTSHKRKRRVDESDDEDDRYRNFKRPQTTRNLTSQSLEGTPDDSILDNLLRGAPGLVEVDAVPPLPVTALSSDCTDPVQVDAFSYDLSPLTSFAFLPSSDASLSAGPHDFDTPFGPEPRESDSEFFEIFSMLNDHGLTALPKDSPQPFDFRQSSDALSIDSSVDALLVSAYAPPAFVPSFDF